ncbi:hypothetical protein niasHT_031792 [Heterodera trifolii]|uniref:FLYWCH-type domain-containing protein n=1 Tax=Heterodera trifolii TaxID=157864 RepID=A0ABD2ITF2_9BILA
MMRKVGEKGGEEKGVQTFRQLDISPTDISPTFISPTNPKTFISPTQPKTFISPTQPKTFISPTYPKSDISPTDISPNSVLNAERTDAEQQMEGTSTRNDLDVAESDDEENCAPVHFQRGKTIRGALCIWHQGFRFLKIRSDGSWFRCERRNCPATAKLEDEELMTGVLGPKEHHHGLAPSRFHAESKRNQMKQLITENPKQQPSQLRAQIRTNVNDEVFELLGTNEALDQMTNRAKNKFVGKVNCADPLQIQIPAGLLKKDDEFVLIYDSREVRAGQSDVLLSMLKQNRRWSLDGTFRSAPKPWTQVFVIGCYVNNRMVVAAQALLPGKASKYYAEVLQQLKRAIDPVIPIKGNQKSKLLH